MSAIDNALTASKTSVHPSGDLSAEPTGKLAVLTCMDARLDPIRDLGLERGDAHVIRNAGGRATDDALRSLLLSWHTLGTREVLVLHHTHCGVHVDDEEALRARLAERTATALDGIDLHTFSDYGHAMKDDIDRVRSSPFAPEGLTVRGAIHDVEAGTVREVMK